MKKILLWLGCLLSFSWQLSAQTTITGTVTGADVGESLPGVNVTVVGTTQGAVTDLNGQYRLQARPTDQLRFSFVGYNDEVVTVGNRTTINIELNPDLEQLSEVVVVGYGTQLKEELTGNIARVSGEELQNLPITSAEQALQGRAAGVYVNQGSGKLGAGINVRVRGSASVSASNQPLYVVDGIPITSVDISAANSEPINPIADINPNDIASIEILKDASAAAIYGARASNGVVLITTKTGKPGKTNINLNYFTGFSEPTNIREFLSAEQYIDLFTEAAVNEGYDPAEEFFFELGIDDINSYDGGDAEWWKRPFQTGSVSQYELSLNGGNDKTRFYLSGSYSDQEGIIIGNEFSRMSARLNLDHSINDRFLVGTNIMLARSLNRRVSDDNAFSNPIQLNALPPLQPVFTEDGELNNNTLYYNNLIDQKYGDNDAITYRSIGNIFGQYQLTERLKFRTENGIDFLNLQEEIYLGKQTEDGGPTGYGYNAQGTVVNFTTNNTLSYVFANEGDYKFDVLAGYSYQKSQVSGNSATGRGFPSNQFKKISSAAQIPGASSTATEYAFVSYFSRANFSFKDRYLFTASVRTDGSSRFGANNRYGTFPAASAGWILSEENFLNQSSFLSFLKLRASYGITGNAEISNFASLALVQASPYEDVAGLVFSTLPNPDLQWEKTKQVDIGLDFAFLKNRISGEIDYYQKNTYGLLLNLPLPAYSGYTTIIKNIGSLENKGYEFVLDAQVLDGGFGWKTSFNFAHNDNKVTNLNDQVIFGESSRFLGQVREGYPIGVFWGPKYAGVDPANGDALYFVSANSSETTNDYAEAEDQMIGNPNPDFIGGFSNTFSYKGISLDVLFQFVKGNDIYNVGGVFQSVNGDYFDNQTVDQLRRWQQPGDITDVPQARLYAANGTGRSSRWVQDGSFTRLKNLRLSYSLPGSLTERAKLRSVQIYAQGTNLLTFTDYDGYDPEVNTTFVGQSNITLGHDFYTPPLARTITFGVNIGL